MRKAIVVVGAGVASVSVVILVFLMYQQAAEHTYVSEVGIILSDRDKIIGEFMSELLPRMEAKQISITEAKSRVMTLVNDADMLRERASAMIIPDKYRSAHPHLVKGLEQFVNAVKSTEDALQHTESAMQSAQQLQIPPSSVIGAIFGFASLPSSEMPALRSDIETARATFNGAVSYLAQSEDELELFSSSAQMKISFSSPSKMLQPGTSKVTPEQIEMCKELGIPEFICSQEQIIAKKRLIGGQSGDDTDTKH